MLLRSRLEPPSALNPLVRRASETSFWPEPLLLLLFASSPPQPCSTARSSWLRSLRSSLSRLPRVRDASGVVAVIQREWGECEWVVVVVVVVWCAARFEEASLVLRSDSLTLTSCSPLRFSASPDGTDHCSPYTTCPDCIAQQYCGWCSTPVIGGDGKQCAGFNPNSPTQPCTSSSPSLRRTHASPLATATTAH